MYVHHERIPALGGAGEPPLVLGAADLTSFAFQGHDLLQIMGRIDRFHDQGSEACGGAGRLYDMGLCNQLVFRRQLGLGLQARALELSPLFRVRGGLASTEAGQMRLLAVMAPGDLMANTPLDFLTNFLDVRLDLLYLQADRALPREIPDHDVAFFAVGNADPEMARRLALLFAAWPRPALNDPRFLAGLQRDVLADSLAGVDGICSPTTIELTRGALLDQLESGGPVQGFDDGLYPCLIRPLASHAGMGLAKIDSEAGLVAYLGSTAERDFFVSRFEDYAGADGMYRKMRVAFIDGAPFLCHMAVSENWMVHYFNAGMLEFAARRDEEAQAMANFDHGFAVRHAAAFAALHARLGFDFYTIDCAETRDGRLLIFEADASAIVHMMDAPEMFPYKGPQMMRVFEAFGAMVKARAALCPDPC